MKMDKVAGSGNDEFYTPYYAIEPLLKYLPTRSLIWCPFDTTNSLIYKTLNLNGHITYPTHIENGHDFFTTTPVGNIIISNPPYSMKNEVFNRLFEIGKPFAMLAGIVGLFESEKRFSMFDRNNSEMMYFNKRISYLKSYTDIKPALNPPFSSAWVCSGILPRPVIFERVDKNKVHIPT